MTTSQNLREELSKPFSAKYIEWRVGATNAEKTRGTALPYMTARAVQDRLDDVVGPGGWEAKYRVADIDVLGRKMPAMFCAISLFIGGVWVTKEDGVEISAVDGDRSHIDPIKTAVSDAFKRAAVHWGLGRYLYEFTAPWVALREGGRGFAETPSLPAHMLPQGETPARAPANAPAAQNDGAANKPEGTTDKPATEKPAQRAAAAKQPTRAAAAPAEAAAPEPAAEEAAAVKTETPADTAAAPATEAAAASEPAKAAEGGASESGVLASLEGTARETAKNVLERARTKKAPISLLRNYLKGESAKKLFNPEAIIGLNAELDAIEKAA